VGRVTETFTLDQNITAPIANLVTALGGDAVYPNANLPLSASVSAAENFRKLQNLGLSLSASGFSSPSGLNIALNNGSAANVSALMGMPTQASGSLSPNIPFNAISAYDFSLAPETLDITLNGKTETLLLNTPVTNAASLAAALSNGANATALAKLGVVATPLGLSALNNATITLANGGSNVYSAMGIVGDSVSTSMGIAVRPGDKFVIESTRNQGLLTTVSRFSEAMKAMNGSQQSKDELSKMMAKTLVNLENAITNLSSVQGEVGARQNMLTSTKSLNVDITLNSQEILSQLQDLDFAEASTRMQMQSFVLSAAQQSFIKISELSLFRYM
jgi:flagellar hook-associated protein 3 FlgL